jgi:hypothetical protein
MKKLFIAVVAIWCAMPTSAANPEEIRYGNYPTPRREIFLPKVNGYNIYKADLHIHSIYSDGHVTPDGRVTEAWYDGLDIIAMTEHLESRKREQEYLNFLKGYNGGTPKQAKNWWVYKVGPDEDGILADLNVATQAAVKQAAAYDITLIPGIEITREPKEFGHYNLLFLKDANEIFDRDPLVALRNARKQGALIIHNHPGWERTTNGKNEFHEKAYGEGLIDGVEVANSLTFYPNMIDRCLEEKLFMAANTDVHGTTADYYGAHGLRRNMTLILAKDKSLESVREALEQRRTMGYCAGQIAGDEALLKALFKESVKIELQSVDKRKKQRYYVITNTSSLDYTLYREKASGNWTLPAMSSIRVNFPMKMDLKVTVLNMWYGADKHPVVKLD